MNFNKNNFPKISIVTPSFNQGEYIEQTIRSVLLQNYPNLEYIIMDGGSTDDTVKIIKKYEKWITYWETENDRGQAHAINKGLTKCSGEIFNWINSDDYYYPNCFNILASNFDLPATFVVAGNYRFFNEEEKQETKVIEFKLRPTLEENIAFTLINQPSTFFRLDKFKNLGSMDENLNYVMDQDIWIKYLFKYGQNNVKIVTEDLADFRLHSKSKTSQYLFESEYYSLFYSIALKNGMKKHAETIYKIYHKEINKTFDFKYNFTEKDKELVNKVINNLIFFNARNFFTSEKFDLLKLCLSTLDKKYLNTYQIKYAKGLKIKSKLIKYKLYPILKHIVISKNEPSRI